MHGKDLLSDDMWGSDAEEFQGIKLIGTNLHNFWFRQAKSCKPHKALYSSTHIIS